QTMATIVLWTITFYLIQENKFYWISLIPAVFMTAVIITYILVAPEGFGVTPGISQLIGAFSAALAFLLTMKKVYKKRDLVSADIS
ncbi:MAG: carbon starvation CstA 5TM domain-containing protein, partial [Ginsengibacter sp.]